jgi:hypothetical protein
MIQHSGGLECGMERLRTGSKGEIYMGGLGTGSQDNQGWLGKVFGLQKLVPNNTQVFEIISVRSRAKGMEIEFSMPVGPAAEAAASYTVQQWRYLPDSAYGGPKRDTQTRSIKNILVSPDRKKVFLEINGLATKQVVYIATKDIKSQEGNKSLWYPKTWYTLNAMSASQPFESTTAARPSESDAAGVSGGLRAERVAGKLRISLPDGPAYRVRLLDFQGRVVGGDVSGAGSAEFEIPRGRSGLHLIRAEREGKSLTLPIVL